MATTNHEFKNQFVVKLQEFQLNGLQQYAKYLKQQLNYPLAMIIGRLIKNILRRKLSGMIRRF